jgi:hypothetical protein
VHAFFSAPRKVGAEPGHGSGRALGGDDVLAARRQRQGEGAVPATDVGNRVARRYQAQDALEAGRQHRGYLVSPGSGWKPMCWAGDWCCSRIALVTGTSPNCAS